MTLGMIIPLALIVVALLIIVVVVVRKFPNLLALDVDALPGQKETATRNRLLWEKMARQVRDQSRRLGKAVQPAAVGLVKGVKKGYIKAVELERSYRQKMGPRSIQEQEKVDAKTDTLVEQAYENLKEDNFEQAEKKFIDAIALDHKDIEAYKGLGELYLEQGNVEEARQAFEHVLRLNAESYDAFSQLGLIARQKGELEKARDYFQKTIDLDAQGAVHYIDLADVYRQLGDDQSAFEALQKAVGLEPNHPRNLDALLDLSILMGKIDEAKELYARLAVVNPENKKLPDFELRIQELGDKKKKK